MANIKKLTRDYGEIIWTGKKCIMGMPISFTRYILTDSKLITRVGLLNLKEDEIELYRVYDKSMKLPFGQRIVGCGTITLLFPFSPIGILVTSPFSWQMRLLIRQILW